jgi:hypothetical protein
MTSQRAACIAVLTAWCAASGCTTLQEIPRTEYTALNERRAVRVFTRDSLSYEFDYATITRDSLVGFRRNDVEDGGPVPEYTSLAMPLDNIEKLSARKVDWYRTGLIGGLGVLAVAGAGLAKNAVGGSGEPSGGSGGGRIP